MRRWISAVVIVAIMAIGMIMAYDKQEKPQQAAETAANGLGQGVKAPDFELKTLTGETVRLSDYKGKKVMLNFWATWCPPCKAEMPDMEKFHKETGENITILAVNLDPQNDVKGFADKNGITFPILLDEEDKVNALYQTLSIPTTYFIDSKGIIQNKYIGAMSLDIMKENTDDLK